MSDIPALQPPGPEMTEIERRQLNFDQETFAAWLVAQEMAEADTVREAAGRTDFEPIAIVRNVDGTVHGGYLAPGKRFGDKDVLEQINDIYR